MNINELKEAATAALGSEMYVSSDIDAARFNYLALANPSTVLSLIARVEQMEEALRQIAEYTGTGPATTPWQAIVKDLSDTARAALEAPSEEVANADPR